MQDHERRKAPRQEYECVVLIAQGADGFIGNMENVSAVGCCTTRPADWALSVGADVRLYLLIDLSHVFSVEAKVAWANDRYLGFEYFEAQALPI